MSPVSGLSSPVRPRMVKELPQSIHGACDALVSPVNGTASSTAVLGHAGLESPRTGLVSILAWLTLTLTGLTSTLTASVRRPKSSAHHSRTVPGGDAGRPREGTRAPRGGGPGGPRLDPPRARGERIRGSGHLYNVKSGANQKNTH